MEQKKTTLLIVEDEENVRKPFVDELNDQGFRVLIAEDGRQGMEMALAEKPDLILLDILMPVMDGLTMMRKLRESGQYGKMVPIILLTNLSPNEDKIIMAVSKDEPAYYIVKADSSLANVVEKIRERLSRGPDVHAS